MGLRPTQRVPVLPQLPSFLAAEPDTRAEPALCDVGPRGPDDHVVLVQLAVGGLDALALHPRDLLRHQGDVAAVQRVEPAVVERGALGADGVVGLQGVKVLWGSLLTQIVDERLLKAVSSAVVGKGADVPQAVMLGYV